MADKAKILADLGGTDKDARFAAWRAAGDLDPDALPALARLAASSDPGTAKAGREAIVTLCHSVGKETSARRTAVADGLLALAGTGQPLPVRVIALRQLSLLADEGMAGAIARWIHEPDLREEVTFCLERIPGSGSVKALLASYKDAREDFKPRILAALGHRKAAEAAGLCVEAMRSSNKEIAAAALKAYGRIGRKVPGARLPDPGAWSEWQKIEHMDAQLRWADEQSAQGNYADAMRVYKLALERSEEHWQCAGIIGIGRMKTAEAAVAVFPKLRSSGRTVRKTAERVWREIGEG